MEEKVNKDLDWHLENAVDYGSEYYNYVPSQEAMEYGNLVAAIYGGEFENETPIMHYMMFDAMHSGKNICLVAHRGSGKALALDTKVCMARGGKKSVKDIRLGEQVLDGTGKPCKVIAKSKIFEDECFKVKFKMDRRSVVACKDHNWFVYKNTSGNGRDALHKVTSKQLFNKQEERGDGKTGYFLGVPVVRYAFRVPPVIPPEVFIDCIMGEGNWDMYAKAIFQNTQGQLEELTSDTHIRKLFIPRVYKYGTVAMRVRFIRHLFEEYTIDFRGQETFTHPSSRVVKDVFEIMRSLAIMYPRSLDWSVFLQQWFIPLKQFRKAVDNKGLPNDRRGKKRINKFNVTVEKHETVKTQCLTVDSKSKSFLLDGFIPTGNSTVMAQNLFFYVAIYGYLPRIGRVKFAIYVSDTVQNGCKTMTSNMRYTYDNSEFLKEMIPTAKFTEGLWEMTNLNGQMLSVRIYGAESGIRGGREQNTRPNLAVIDDVLNDKNAISETKLNGIKKVIFAAINYALHPKNMKIIIGTPFHSKCVVSEAVASGTYYNLVFPIAENFPCEKKDFKGSWGDRFGFDEVLKIYNEAKAGLGDLSIQGFYQELMLSPSGKDRTLVKRDRFRSFSREAVLNRMEAYNFYITTDFATTDKDSSDLSVIFVWAYNSAGEWHLMDGYAGKSLMDENIDRLFNFVRDYPVQEVGIEINGQQGGFIQWIRREMEQRDLYFKFATSSIAGNTKGELASVDGIKSTGNKMQRFMNIQPIIQRKEILVAYEHANSFYQQEFFDEFLKITPESVENAFYDDVIDATTQIQYLKVIKPHMADYGGSTVDPLDFKGDRASMIYDLIKRNASSDPDDGWDSDDDGYIV